MHEAHEKDRQEHLMCDFCPLKWLSQLCFEVEGKNSYLCQEDFNLLNGFLHVFQIEYSDFGVKM